MLGGRDALAKASRVEIPKRVFGVSSSVGQAVGPGARIITRFVSQFSDPVKPEVQKLSNVSELARHEFSLPCQRVLAELA